MCALNKQYALNNNIMYLTTSKYSILRTYLTVFEINTYLMYSLSQCHIMLAVSEKQYNNCEKYEYSTKK